MYLDSDTSYLQLEDVESKEKTCYEINGITENTLSIRHLTSGNIMLFKRH